MPADIQEILMNKEVLAVDQDPLGMQGRRVRRDASTEIWAKQMKDGSRTVVLFNRGSSQADVSVSWEEVGYPGHVQASVRDLWMKKDLGKFTGNFSATVPAHGVMMVRLMP
jgi:alpha-galactosidase